METDLKVGWVYERSPLARVTFTIDFALEPFASNLFGLYWAQIRSRFPVSEQERPPILTAGDDPATTFFAPLPPLRRVVYESINRSRSIELQPARFVYLWQKTADELQYPRFTTLRAQMSEEWNAFSSFVISEFGVPPKLSQFMLGYRNEIGRDHGWQGSLDTHRFLHHIGSMPKRLATGEHCYLEFETPRVGSAVLITEDSEYHSAGDEKKAPTHLYFDLRVQSGLSDDSNLEWFSSGHALLADLFHEALTPQALEMFGAREEPSR